MNLAALGIACKNIQQTIEFYQLLGLQFEASGEDHYEATTPSGLRLMLDSYKLLKEINPNWQEPKSPGVTLCFLQSSPTEVDACFAKIKSAGFHSEKEPWDAFWGQRYASVRDPDGNQVDLFAPLS